MIAQIRSLALTSRAFRNDQLPPLLEKLCTLSGFDKALLMNGGAEAVETAIKAMRKWGYEIKGIEWPKAEIIVAEGNFHGRTTTIVGFSSDPTATAGFGPFTPGFRMVPFGDLAAVAAAITPETAAIFVEPIQGERGTLIPPAGYLRGLRELADQNHCLLVLDEIQSGFGRTGRMFAFEHEGIRPDGITVGKALSGGFYPVSVVLSSRAVLGVFGPGDHGSTFGGNPLACAIARAALRVIVDEDLPARSASLGEYALKYMKGLRSPYIVEVRGKGLWIGIELNRPARPFCEALEQRGVLCKETHERVIRLAPPLIISKADLEWGLEQVRAVLEDGPDARNEAVAELAGTTVAGK
jgi:ornithine--oxo-acid transaminase